MKAINWNKKAIATYAAAMLSGDMLAGLMLWNLGKFSFDEWNYPHDNIIFTMVSVILGTALMFSIVNIVGRKVLSSGELTSDGVERRKRLDLLLKVRTGTILLLPYCTWYTIILPYSQLNGIDSMIMLHNTIFGGNNIVRLISFAAIPFIVLSQSKTAENFAQNKVAKRILFPLSGLIAIVLVISVNFYNVDIFNPPHVLLPETQKMMDKYSVTVSDGKTSLVNIDRETIQMCLDANEKNGGEGNEFDKKYSRYLRKGAGDAQVTAEEMIELRTAYGDEATVENNFSKVSGRELHFRF